MVPYISVFTLPQCDKFCSVGAIASGVQISNDNASDCSTKSTSTTPDSFLMSCCKMDGPSEWHQGSKVLYSDKTIFICLESSMRMSSTTCPYSNIWYMLIMLIMFQCELNLIKPSNCGPTSLFILVCRIYKFYQT